MAKLKGKGVVMTALVAGAASFLSKKENRDNTAKFFKDMKSKLFGSTQHTGTQSLKEIAETAAGATSTKIRENNFISEGGGQTALAYYNEADQKQVH
ncbi:hypothetical protein [Ureibacillus aquaedulcis]|uniref:Uncharacterized protein n=1 Tax=Ureibacillus aquaedulcis TaxID=3058421 RepID=A0ABT8GVP7_9BACL|nr:hypothetical protein [Ureibacillus sp. BA0131]MDN4495457.1 hypothetical protein [Ureibacillus sp. BA0131]